KPITLRQFAIVIAVSHYDTIATWSRVSLRRTICENFDHRARFDLKIFTAMASRIIPKTRRNTAKPEFPITRSSHADERRTTYTKMRLITIPMRMLISEYPDRSERIVVSVPAPAMIGKASGTIEPDPWAFGSSFINVIPSIISMATINITMAPATAKEAMSRLNNASTD